MQSNTSTVLTNPSTYFFSASKLHEGSQPTVVECVAASPPRRVRGVELTVTRIFKNRGLSLRKLKESSKPKHASQLASDSSLGAEPQRARNGASSLRGSTPPRSTPLRAVSLERSSDDDLSPSHQDILTSPAGTPPSSPSPPERTLPKPVANARSPVGRSASMSNGTVRDQAAPYPKPSASSRGRITRTSSRSSTKVSSKLGRKASFAKIAELLDPSGAILTRYGAQDGEPIFIREERNTSTTEPDVMTYFWESFTAVPLRNPPDLTSRPKLAIGDVYCNIVIVQGRKPSAQLWIWTAGPAGEGFWQRASPGDVREDGRGLSVTPKRLNPSWVQPYWAVKQLRNARG